MKQRIKSLGALLLALALSLSLALPASAAGSPVDEAGKAAAAAAMTYGQAAQAAWAVWQDGDIIASGREGGSQEKPGDLYGAGSVSKIYTAAAVMQLAEDGKLDLDQPVVKYLPEFTMADERYRDITVRMLLNHSSGLMGSSMGSALLFEDASALATDQLLERLSTQRLKADPGAYSTYCN
ncbi:MAG: beta-lactamase family protein, partial [Dysosmobacter sp.]|nr:beta-lactamase family protein [Dysosmobacter sp.]